LSVSEDKMTTEEIEYRADYFLNLYGIPRNLKRDAKFNILKALILLIKSERQEAIQQEHERIIQLGEQYKDRIKGDSLLRKWIRMAIDDYIEEIRDRK